MPLTPRKSSNVEATAYDAESQLLTVQFKGGVTYYYRGVGQDLVDEMDKAESIGSFIQSRIVRNDKLTVEKEEPKE